MNPDVLRCRICTVHVLPVYACEPLVPDGQYVGYDFPPDAVHNSCPLIAFDGIWVNTPIGCDLVQE